MVSRSLRRELRRELRRSLSKRPILTGRWKNVNVKRGEMTGTKHVNAGSRGPLQPQPLT